MKKEKNVFKNHETPNGKPTIISESAYIKKQRNDAKTRLSTIFDVLHVNCLMPQYLLQKTHGFYL